MQFLFALLVTPTPSSPFYEILRPVTDLADALLIPAMGLTVALGAVYCIFLGVKLAKAEEQQDRDKAKQGLKNALIGFALIFVLITVLYIGSNVLLKWVNANKPAPGSTITTIDVLNTTA